MQCCILQNIFSKAILIIFIKYELYVNSILSMKGMFFYLSNFFGTRTRTAQIICYRTNDVRVEAEKQSGNLPD